MLQTSTKGVQPVALIAIVDDSRLARTFAAAALKQGGHEVAEVEPSNLEDVLGALRLLQPALLVLDQKMPAFEGSSLVRACFQDAALASLKVVMLTAQHDDDLDGRMANLGVHQVLHKPIRPPELAQAVADLLQVDP